jgi:hypothetical protein
VGGVDLDAAISAQRSPHGFVVDDGGVGRPAAAVRMAQVGAAGGGRPRPAGVCGGKA